MKIFILSCLVLYFFLGRSSFGVEVEKELEGVKKRIRQEKLGMKKMRKEEKSILGILDRIERDLDAKGKQLKNFNSKLKALLLEHHKMEIAVGQVELSLRLHRERLVKRASAIYRWRRGGSPFILLNGVISVGELMRRRRYLAVMMERDRILFDVLIREVNRQDSLKKELDIRKDNLDRERNALLQIREGIRQEKEKKRKILARLYREKEMRSRIMKELEQAARKLEEMLSDIGRSSVKELLADPSGKEFVALKGKLDYPVRGQVIGGFGRTRHPEFPAELFRKGINFKASFGEKIRAVHGGQVIFADRFVGYGKMIVIEHSQRFYTIYAHLSKLLRKSGVAVRKGEAIALVGDTESLGGSRLYFEIRNGVKALNPFPWFRQE